MYTELCLNVRLRADASQEAISTLRAMVEDCLAGKPVPDHPAFKKPRILCGIFFHCGSAYFAAEPHVTFSQRYAGTWYLNTTFNLKNYENEIEAFLDWLMPYIDAHEGEFLGYQRYEEDELPTLILMPKKAGS